MNLKMNVFSILNLLKNKKDKDWKGYWNDFYIGKIRLPKSTIKKLIGRNLTYDDEPVELKNDISSYRNK